MMEVPRFRDRQMVGLVLEEMVSIVTQEAAIREILREMDRLGQEVKETVEYRLKAQRMELQRLEDAAAKKERLRVQELRKKPWIAQFWAKLEDEIDLETVDLEYFEMEDEQMELEFLEEEYMNVDTVEATTVKEFELDVDMMSWEDFMEVQEPEDWRLAGKTAGGDGNLLSGAQG